MTRPVAILLLSFLQGRTALRLPRAAWMIGSGRGNGTPPEA